jgi:hypothetical protein
VGVETAGITVSKIIVKWFRGKELALAMGLEMATARLGTMLALQTSAPIAKALGHVSMPILMALILLCIGMIAFFIYCGMDKKLDASIAEADKDVVRRRRRASGSVISVHPQEQGMVVYCYSVRSLLLGCISVPQICF